MISLTALASVLVALSVAAVLSKYKVIRVAEGSSRYASIDGVRGLLALVVFFHHYMITYYWKQTGNWSSPPSELYENFGKVGVSVFFMITGFLFIGKLLDTEKPNWLTIFSSRAYRILPLYLAALIAITVIVIFASEPNQFSTNFELLKDYTRWFLFIGGPISGFEDTPKIIAGVHWTLKYEWLFYLALPAIALTLKLGRRAIFFLSATVIVLSVFPITAFNLINTVHLLFFLIGGFTAKLVRLPKDCSKIAESKLASTAAVLLLLIALYATSPLSLLQAVALGLLFTLVASGNSIFGLLTCRPCRLLGEISYSVYLLHGLLLYIAFTLVFPNAIGRLSLGEYMAVMPLLTIVVVLVSTQTFKFVEDPMIRLGKYRASKHISHQNLKITELKPKPLP